MENPKPMETLEAEIPKEASGMSDIFSGLGSVSEIPDEFGDDEEKGSSVIVEALPGPQDSTGEEEKEASTEGISLYVDIRGSPDRASEYSVGDIVWAKSKNQTWWPGKIHDPAKAPKYALRLGHGDDILVVFYGTGQFAWFSRPHLKPFHEAFDRMVKRKNKADLSFLVAVDRAAEDFGSLAKSEMTCSCQSKLAKKRLLGQFSAAEFDPASFLGGLKFFALFGSVSRAIDVSVARNRLSAFCRSVGHVQLPPYRLAERKILEEEEEEEEEESSPKKSRKKCSGDGSRKRKTKKVLEEVNEVEESTPIEKGFESRERKKSKYLSYPYVNFEQRSETGRVDSVAPPGDAIPKNTGEKFWRKWYLQLGAENNDSEARNMASSEVLRELRFAAVNDLSSEGFGLTACFLSKYRVSAYSEESAVEICPKNAEAQSEATEIKTKIKKNSMKSSKISEGTESGVSKRKSFSGREENGPKRKSGKKKGDPVNDGALGMSNGKTKLLPRKKGSSPEKGLVSDKAMEESNKAKRKSTKKKKKGNATKKESETLVDATLGTAMPQTDPLEMKTKSLSGLSDVKIISAGIGVSVKEALEKNRSLSHCKKKKKETAIPDLNGIGAKPEVAKDSNVVMEAMPGNLIVDLSISPENVPDLNGTKEEGEQKKKKKKKKDKIEVVLKYPKNKSMAGSTALVLSFAPGEGSGAATLASTFRKFGPLKESETRVWKEPNGGRVVFENACDASEALRSLERDNPFGPGLVGFRLLTPPAPPLDSIKKNLQMMTQMLEKSGDNLSQEMRAKLEEEIKGLLSKLTSMPASS